MDAPDLKVESILLTVTSIGAFSGETALTQATGFYFRRDQRWFLVTNRHVVLDEASDHRPDRIEIGLHTEPKNLAVTSSYSIPLYKDGQAVWREAVDSGGQIDVVAIPLDDERFPHGQVLIAAFTPGHLPDRLDSIEVGDSVRAVGHPLSFQDDLHKLPLMRHAIVASSFGLRFNGHGYFLTDSLLHRGSSGSPVVLRTSSGESGRSSLPWQLLGVHSARLHAANRDASEDERLNLFATWYADILTTLTEP
jgi:hypothetical protein